MPTFLLAKNENTIWINNIGVAFKIPTFKKGRYDQNSENQNLTGQNPDDQNYNTAKFPTLLKIIIMRNHYYDLQINLQKIC